WQAATPLSEAWLAFANSSSAPKRPRVRKIAAKEYSPKSGMGMLLARLDDAQREGLVKAVGAFETLTDSVRKESVFNDDLKTELLKRLQNGELLAFGFSMNEAATAPPIQIPHRFFVARFFKWRLDVISDPPIEFRQVRIAQIGVKAQSVRSSESMKVGRPSAQEAIFEALNALVQNDPSMYDKQRKTQSDEVQKYIK
ncbi:unnamed protein product, partial [Phaeothamnion confervicola]